MNTAARRISYEAEEDVPKATREWSTPLGNGGYALDREKLAARINKAVNDATKKAHADTAPAFRDLNLALQMIRDAVEELGPVGACSVSRDQFEPRPIDDAEAIISGIQKAIEWERHKYAALVFALRDLLEEAQL